jgi:hypothetical protein
LLQPTIFSILAQPPKFFRVKPEKQKGKKEGGLGEGIFALLRLRIERFRFSLIKRNTKQKKFLFLLKDKVNCEARESALRQKVAREKIKKCRENFFVLVCCSGAEASGNVPHSCSGFPLKKVRISFRIRSKQKTLAKYQYFYLLRATEQVRTYFMSVNEKIYVPVLK